MTGLEESASSALAKLEQSLSAETRERIAAVEQAMVALAPTDIGGIDIDVVVTIARAIRESRRMRVDYTRHDGTEVRRSIEPHRILNTAHRWYLVAWDVDRETWRTLRVDRLMPRLPLGARFRSRVIPDEELRRFTTRSISVSPWRYHAVLRIHAPVAEVRRHFGPTIARVEQSDGGGSLLETGTQSWEELALYVGTTGMDFEVIEGEGFKEVLERLSERLKRASSY